MKLLTKDYLKIVYIIFALHWDGYCRYKNDFSECQLLLWRRKSGHCYSTSFFNSESKSAFERDFTSVFLPLFCTYQSIASICQRPLGEIDSSHSYCIIFNALKGSKVVWNLFLTSSEGNDTNTATYNKTVTDAPWVCSLKTVGYNMILFC